MHLDFGYNKLFSGGFMKKVLFIEYPKCTTCQKAKSGSKTIKLLLMTAISQSSTRQRTS